jgi:hydroxymethylpyrimidine/phosphomethylpyrimidine kinase
LGHIFTQVHLATPKQLKAEALLNLKLQTLQNVEQGTLDLLKMGVQAVYIKGCHRFGFAHYNKADTATDFLPHKDEQAEDVL